VFTVVGEALLDLVQPSPGDTYRAMPGGGPLNIAVGLRRMDHPTAMMARFSTSALGTRIRERAAANGLDLSACVATDRQATLAFATLDEDGRASYDFYVEGGADWGWTEAELAAVPPATRAIHTGSMAASIEPGASRILDWWSSHAARGDVVLSFDPNIRPAIAGPRADAVTRAERFVALSHVVKTSDEDLAWLYPDQQPSDVVRRWAGLGPSLTVLTMGPDGCRGVTANGVEVCLPAPDVTVVDTIGAGDAFQAGLLSGLADIDRMTPKALASLTKDDVREVLERALVIAGLTCERAGADPPTRVAYEDYVSPRAAQGGAHS
jgi:fructokinase